MKSSCTVLLVVLALVFVWYWCFNRKKEKFTNLAPGAPSHLDSLDGQYELVTSPDQVVSSAHFADMIDAGDHEKMIAADNAMDGSLTPMERLDRLQSETSIPLTSAHVPAYNVDVANPMTYSFAVNAPRVILKNRVAMQADPFRGDIPINYKTEIPMVSGPQYDRDAQRLDGYFSDHYVHLYNKLTGRGYKNRPLKVATEETIMDYVPS